MTQALTEKPFPSEATPVSSPGCKSNTETARPASRPGSPRPDESRWQLRLVITTPALLVLFILTYGLISYFSFTNHWDALESMGASEPAADILHTHMVAMIVLAVIATVMGVALSLSILRPIRAIMQTAENVALGKFDSYAPVMPASRELSEFSRSFNAMIDQLNHSIADRNRRLIDGLPMGVLTLDMEGRINTVNPMAAECLGLDIHQLMGQTFDTIEALIPVRAQRLTAFIRHTLSLDFASTTHELTLQADETDVGKRSLMITATHLRGIDQIPLGVMFYFRDAQKVRDLSVQIGLTDQLAMLGTFSLGLAHELRNPLGAIKGLSQLLLLERNLSATTGGYLERMTREVDRVDLVMRDLLDLSTQPVGRPAPTDVALMLTEAREIARIGIGRETLDSVDVHCRPAPMPSLLLQGDRMVQAIAKIINNAYHACESDGQIWIETQWLEHPSGPACEIHIRNNGAAIHPENERKIFEPFFTTRERATGLGLTIANQIVMQNEGKLELCNSTKGVDFMIRFAPARTADAACWPEATQKGAQPCR